MKDKKTASILALLVGGLGIHRFYLGQIGRGILCVATIPVSIFVAPLIGLKWLLSSDESFNNTYNKQRIQLAQMEVQKEMLQAIKNNK